MKDCFGREIEYLRLSVTDRCNLRCRYCMPEDGVYLKTHDQILSEDEMVMAARAASLLGIKKVRITGGEPLVKKNILSICKRISEIEGINELCLTTNGLLLPSLAKDLVKAGVTRVNISLNTLSKEKYEYISRRPAPEDLLLGIKAALEAGFKKIKVNTVLIGKVNDDEIEEISKLAIDYPVDVRFIELMPMYDSGDFSEDSFISVDTVLKRLNLTDKRTDGVSKVYRLEGAKGSVGVISPISDSFCESCNRIRLTADGYIKPCLHSSQEIYIKGLDEEQIKEKFKEAVMAKPACHEKLSFLERSGSTRNMNKIGG